MAKAEYFLLNWLNNQRPYGRIDPRLEVRDFVLPAVSTYRDALPRGSSPSRTLSDLFWLTLPWPTIGEELGEIRILDVGCGSGSYGPRMIAWAGGRIAVYAGADARPHAEWPALETRDRRLRFHVARAEHFADSIPRGTNMFISQSAVEHFDDDLGFFEQIRDYQRAVQGPVLQVHLVPSQACLRLYHLHGVRQYTPRTLSHITRLFGNDTYAVLHRLGGSACNTLHFTSITKPQLFQGGRDLRGETPIEYDRQLFDAIASDMRQPQRSPAFYALVIHSRWNKRIF